MGVNLRAGFAGCAAALSGGRVLIETSPSPAVWAIAGEEDDKIADSKPTERAFLAELPLCRGAIFYPVLSPRESPKSRTGHAQRENAITGNDNIILHNRA